MAVNLIQGKQIATASWAQNAVTASYATSASYTATASFAVSSSRALTASHADNTSGISSSITNNVDNYLLTATSGSTINGESNLTFDGVLLSLGQTADGRFQQGDNTSANGTGSHAEGQSTGANGEFSHAEGRRTTANGNYSHTEGYETISSGAYQHVQGQFNIPLPDESAFIIGNGIDDDNRSNLVLASGSEFQVTGSVKTTSGFILKDYTQPNYGAMSFNEDKEYASLTFRSYDETGEFGTAHLNIDAETNIEIGSYSEDGSKSSSIIIADGDIALTNLTDSSGTSIGSAVQLWKDYILLATNNNSTEENNRVSVYSNRTYTTKYIETDEGFIGNYLEAPSITGSLFGTASYATQALSASFAISSSRAISSSFATTASFAISASWAPTQNIDTGSLVTTSSFNAFTSSYNTGSFTGSFTGSLFGTSSFAQTASYAPNYIEKSVGPTYTTNAILTVTQAEYDAIDPKDSTTLYFII